MMKVRLLQFTLVAVISPARKCVAFAWKTVHNSSRAVKANAPNVLILPVRKFMS